MTILSKKNRKIVIIEFSKRNLLKMGSKENIWNKTSDLNHQNLFDPARVLKRKTEIENINMQESDCSTDQQ